MPLTSTPSVKGEIVSEAPKRNDVVERGLLIDGKSVPASSGKLSDDVSPWDGDTASS